MADREKTIKELDRITSVLYDSLNLLKEQSMKEFNINDYIKVKLTKHGQKIHISYYEKFDTYGVNKKFYKPEIDNEGYTEYQLWEFMNIFGEHMFNGADQLIENNLIYFIQEDSK